MELKRIYNRLDYIRKQNQDKKITFTLEFYDSEDNIIFSTKHFNSIEDILKFLNNNFMFIDLASYKIWLMYSIDYNEPEFLADAIFTIINGEFGYEFV